MIISSLKCALHAVLLFSKGNPVANESTSYLKPSAQHAMTDASQGLSNVRFRNYMIQLSPKDLDSRCYSFETFFSAELTAFIRDFFVMCSRLC